MTKIPPLPLIAIAAIALLLTPLVAQDPKEMPDETWISISGTVTSATPDSFMLDYGDGLIRVEMGDDWLWYDQDWEVLPDDRVTVYGEIDDDFFEATEIEADSVYVENRNTYFYAEDFDEEDLFHVADPFEISYTTLRGTVTSVSPDEEEFTIDTGRRRLTVETEEMLYDPLDREGYQQIAVGDRVSVSGRMDSDLFEGREMVASTVITLSRNGARPTS